MGSLPTIGLVPTGDLLLFRKRPGGPDLDEAVFWWDHETARLEKVAHDFSALRPL